MTRPMTAVRAASSRPCPSSPGSRRDGEQPDGETPVNPYSLLEAVNNSSDTAHTAWLIFLAIMAYLTIAVAGVTHKDLLLETPVTLPIMQVQIQLAQFFQFAPVILMLFHLGVVSQLVLLARKTLEFDYAVRALELTDRRTHPLRLELHNLFFVQAVAGPHRSPDWKDKALLERIAEDEDDFYVNVHTEALPEGAIRGQLGS